jgi:hypothetical protein
LERLTGVKRPAVKILAAAIHSPEVKDWIVKHQIAAEGWYVAHPDLTVRDIHRVKRLGKAVEEFLDKIG